MFQPTHIAHIQSERGFRAVALERVHADGALEVFRDSGHNEYHQWSGVGVVQWPRYQIRALAPKEAVPARYLVAATEAEVRPRRDLWAARNIVASASCM